jgi:hypothetical protein
MDRRIGNRLCHRPTVRRRGRDRYDWLCLESGASVRSRGRSRAAFREAFEIAILPRLQEFGPDLIVISAGFDAHRLDPLANLNLSEADDAIVNSPLLRERKDGHYRKVRSSSPMPLAA